MSEYQTGTCENCGWVGNTTDPVTGANLIDTYDGQMLCSSCRVTAKMNDGSYAADE